jgi:hypothetical protein
MIYLGHRAPRNWQTLTKNLWAGAAEQQKILLHRWSWSQGPRSNEMEKVLCVTQEAWVLLSLYQHENSPIPISVVSDWPEARGMG